MIRNETCACGGIIAVVEPTRDEEVMKAVQRHQDTIRHRVWRSKGGFDADRPRLPDAYEDRLR